MNNEKVDEVLKGYVQMLETLRYPALRHPPEEALPSDPDCRHNTVRRHLTWMCHEALTWSAERLEKKFRWLGFIQGVLWTEGLQIVTQLKDHNKP